MKRRVHELLGLQHHRHTAKRLPHRHTSYRGLWVVLAVVALCIGVIQQTSADSYGINATVPSPVLDQPAVIISPTDGSVVHDSQLTVSGTCQVTVDGTIVSLERDSVLLGSSMCASNGTFVVSVTLIEGRNNIVPKVMTTTNVAGPDGQSVDISYEPIVSGFGSDEGVGGAINAGAARPARGESSQSLLVTSNQPMATYAEDGVTVLRLTVENGVAPYSVVIDWGDGHVDNAYTLKKAGMVQFRHIYQRPNAYIITATVTDVLGQKTVYQIPAVKAGSLATAYTTPALPTIGSLTLTSSFNRFVWGAYISISLGVIALWLAEHGRSLLPVPVPVRPPVKRRR